MINYRACMIFHEQHEISSAAYKLYNNFIFKQKLEFSDIELIYRLQVKQFHQQEHSSHKNHHYLDIRNIFI